MTQDVPPAVDMVLRIVEGNMDGPYSPDRTIAASALLAETARYLNHATLWSVGEGLSRPQDLDLVLEGLFSMGRRLVQTMDQLERYVYEQVPTDLVRIDPSNLFANEPRKALSVVRGQLRDAASGVARFAYAIEQARRVTAAMSLAEPEREPPVLEAEIEVSNGR